MVAMIEKLIASGHAYAAAGHVLFRVRSYQNYGALSGRSVDDMIAGARVEVAPFKEDPMDFVLWKPSSAQEPGWDSPWGRGRPGWHIECSAMAYELLGDTFDIHGGGLDLQFPHHENEIAQSACAHPNGGFAQVWMHNEMLQVEGKKMSKSLGNFFTVRDLLDKGYAGEVIRFVMLSTHYRKPMDWTEAKAREAERALRKWRRLLVGVAPTRPMNEIEVYLSDDLNTAGALSCLGHIGQALYQRNNSSWDVLENVSDSNWSKDASEFLASLQLLGLLTEELSVWADLPDLYPYADKLTELRQFALSTKDFSQVDAFKAALTAAGVEVRMSKSAVELTPSTGFNPAKLDALL